MLLKESVAKMGLILNTIVFISIDLLAFLHLGYLKPGLLSGTCLRAHHHIHNQSFSQVLVTQGSHNRCSCS